MPRVVTSLNKLKQAHGFVRHHVGDGPADIVGISGEESEPNDEHARHGDHVAHDLLYGISEGAESECV